MNAAHTLGAATPLGAAHAMGARRLATPLAENKLYNAVRPQVTLLVEGGSDCSFWWPRVDCLKRCVTALSFTVRLPSNSEGKQISGRQAVLSELDRATNHPDARMLGILDADFDRLSGSLPQRMDVIFTDAHDLETTLLGLPALEKLLHTSLAPDALQRYEIAWNESFRDRLFRHAEGAGRLRWLNDSQSLGLTFKKDKKNTLEHVDHRKGSDTGWSPSLRCFLLEVVNFSNRQEFKSKLDDLVAECAALPSMDRDQLCNGHDLIGFFRAGIETLTGDKKSPNELAERLFLAVELVDLETTQLWQTLVQRCRYLAARA